MTFWKKYIRRVDQRSKLVFQLNAVNLNPIWIPPCSNSSAGFRGIMSGLSTYCLLGMCKMVIFKKVRQTTNFFPQIQPQVPISTNEQIDRCEGLNSDLDYLQKLLGHQDLQKKPKVQVVF